MSNSIELQIYKMTILPLGPHFLKLCRGDHDDQAYAHLIASTTPVT